MQILKTGKKTRSSILEFFILTSLVILLVLSMANLAYYFSPKKVLSAVSQNTSFEDSYEIQDFWINFLNKNPNYIPGWIELNRQDVVKKIDPNYIIP